MESKIYLFNQIKGNSRSKFIMRLRQKTQPELQTNTEGTHKKSPRSGAQYVPIGIPTVICNIIPSNCINILSMEKSSILKISIYIVMSDRIVEKCKGKYSTVNDYFFLLNVI